jgi:hypothetical protein
MRSRLLIAFSKQLYNLLVRDGTGLAAMAKPRRANGRTSPSPTTVKKHVCISTVSLWRKARDGREN